VSHAERIIFLAKSQIERASYELHGDQSWIRNWAEAKGPVSDCFRKGERKNGLLSDPDTIFAS
jgi:hypothetical protein